MTLIFLSLALSLLAGAEFARPANAVLNNANPVVITHTGDHYVYESSYQNPGFYAQGRYWVFYEDTNGNCENQAGCLYYVTSSDGKTWLGTPTLVATPGNSGIHVTDSDWSIVTDGTRAFYARYNETSFDSTCNRALLYGAGALGTDGTIVWQAEQIVRTPSPTDAFPNDVISVDSNGQVWIGYQDDPQSQCGGSGSQTARIIHANNTALPPALLTSGFVANVSNPIVLQTVGFTATASGGKPSYTFTWNFGDGSPVMQGSSVSHAYNTTGTFTVRLLTVDSSVSQQTDNSSQSIVVGLPIGNSPPQLTIPASVAIKTGTTESFTLTATDPDFGDSVTVTTGALPLGASFDNATRRFSWTPTADQASQTWILTFNATDNGIPPLSVTRQMLVYVAPQWSGDISLPASTLSQSIHDNWHVDIAILTGGQVYAAYWANKFPMFGRLFDGSSWGPEDRISLTTESTDVNSFVFGVGSTVYAVWYDTNKQAINAGIKPAGQTWGQYFVGQGEARSVQSLPGNVCTSGPCHRYSLPFTAAINQANSPNPQLYIFWYNQTNRVIDEWSGFPGSKWLETSNSTLTQSATDESTLGSFHYSASIGGGKNAFGLMWIDGGSSPFNLNFALESIGSTSGSTDSSWNPKVQCTPQIVTIEQILGSQVNQNRGAAESGSIFNPGITATSPGDAKRWLTPSAFTNSLAGYQAGGPPCNITNADGQVVSAFVEILGVQRGFLLNEDYSANFDPVNGGGLHPGGANTSDTTFNIFTPGYSVCSLGNTTGCMHTIHAEFDHDWKAAGYCGPGTVCDPYQLAQQSGPLKTLVDFQGFVYWDPDHANEPAHSFSGWELHALTAWRLSGVAPAFTLSSNPSTVTVLPGKSIASNITVNTFNLFSGPLPLTATVTPADSTTPSATFTPSIVHVPPCNQCVASFSTLNITALSSSSGPYIVTVFGHNGTTTRQTTVTVLVQGFTIKANPQSLTIPTSSSANSTITVTSVGNFGGSVTLSAITTGCACGFVTSITPATLTLTPGSKQNATLTVQTSTLTGNAVVNVTATASSLSASTSVAVFGIDFSINSAKPNLTVLSGSNNSTSIGVVSVNGFSGTITLTASSNSTNLTALLNTSSVTLTASGTGSTTTVLLTVNGTRIGNYLVTITATSGSLTHQTTIAVRIVDFSIASSPVIQVNVGSTGTATILLSSLNSFSGTISLTNSTSPSGISWSLGPKIVTLGSGSSQSSILTFLGSIVGNYTATITATTGPLSHSIQIRINVVDFSIAAGSVTPPAVNVGSFGNSTVTLFGLNGFARTVALTFSAPTGLSCSLSSPKLSLPPSPATVVLSCKSPTPADYTVTVTGTNGTLTHTTTPILFHVVDFSIRSFTTSLTLTAGTNSPGNVITLTSINGFNGNVTLTAVVSGSGPSASLAQTSRVLLPNDQNSTTVTITAGPFVGIFTVTITGTNSALAHSATITLTVTRANPAISTTLSATTVLAGGSIIDSSSLTGPTTSTANGTVTYKLFTNNACSSSGIIVSTATVTNGVIPNSRTIVFNSTGPYGFNAVYSGDGNNNGATSACEPLSVIKTSPTLSTSLSSSTIQVGQSVVDSAGLVASFRAIGTVSYNLFVGSSQCSGTASTVSTVTVTNGTVPNSRSVLFNATNAGGYSFQATYSGDTNNNGAGSTCEPLNVNPASGVSINTILSVTSVTVGGTAFDNSTLTGTTPTAGGSVTYQLFTINTCSGTPSLVSLVTVSNSVVPSSRAVIFNGTGAYGWRAAYSGDSNNIAAISSCEQFTVNKATPTVATTLSLTAITVGNSVSDSSTISNGYKASGTMSYEYFAGLICSGTAVAVGTPLTVTNGVVPNSVSQTFNSAGNYTWNAIYSGDSNNNGITSPCEPLAVNKANPTVATTLSMTTPTVGTTVADSATISGGFGAGGTVTYSLFTSSACTSAGTITSVVAVTSNTVPNSRAVQFNQTGSYGFKAVYGGDSNNNAATSPCESLTVQKTTPTIATTLTPATIQVGQSTTDSATLTSFFQATGTVNYNLFVGTTICAASGTTISTAIVSNGTVPNSRSITFNATNSGGYSFQAVYSGDVNNSPANSLCEVLTVNPISGTSIATTLSTTGPTVGNTVTDSATLSGTTSNSGGTVTYQDFASANCGTSPSIVSVVTVTNSAVPSSRPVSLNSTTSLSFNALYSGDANNAAATSACEPLIVQKASPTLVTSLTSTTITVGGSTNDSATLTGGYLAGGTVTYEYFAVAACSGSSTIVGTPVTVSNSLVPNSASQPFNAAGAYSWNAIYSGDSNNNVATSACEPFTVNKASPTITTSLSTTAPVVGTTVTDTAALPGNFNAGGTATYYVFANNLCGATGTIVSVVTLTSGVIPSSRAVQFNQTGPFGFKAIYNGDSNNNGATSTCEPLSVQKTTTTIATALSPASIQVGQSTSDSATLTGSFQATGIVSYVLFSGSSSCGTSGITVSTVPVTNGVIPNSRSVIFNSTNPGGYGFLAAYSGDANNSPSSSLCEALTVNPISGISISTTLSNPSPIVGTSVTDSATLSGTTSNAGGTVTYQTFTNNNCGSSASIVSIVAVTNTIVSNSRSVVLNSTSTISFDALYSGDANNVQATSPCEPLAILKATPTITTNLSSPTITVGGQVNDAASLASGYLASGTVTYETFATPSCSGTPTIVGTPVSVTGGIVQNSASQSFNSAGTFSWNAIYSGDSNNNGATSTCEPLTVNKASPAIATILSSTSPVVGTTVFDSSTLSSSFNASGSVTYNVFADVGCAGSSSIASIVGVSNGAVPNSRPVLFNATGSYAFKASYSGDSNNNAAASACEPLTVQKASPGIATSLSPNSIEVGQSTTDSATLSNSFQPTGSVSYSLFVGSNSCAGTDSIVSTVAVTGGVIPNSRSVLFNSTNPGGYSFHAIYTGDANNNGATSTCEPLAVNPSSQAAITTTLSSTSIVVGNTATDSATLTGATATAGGTVTYRLYGNNACTGSNNAVSVVSVANAVVPNSRAVLFNLTGSFSFQALYSGDANNVGVTSSCEPLTVIKASPTVSTTLSATTVTVGGSVTDSSAITGGYGAGGTVTYSIFTGGTCSGSGTIVSTVTVTNGVVPNSSPASPAPAGSYSFNAVYAGDVNNNGATSSCEPLTVNKTNPTIATSLSASSIISGQSVTDSAGLTGSFNAVGTVTYNLFSTGGTCSASSASVSIATVSNNVVANSRAVIFNATGSYSFQAVYSGDANNNLATSICEPLTVVKASPTISTTLSSASVIVGGSVSDSSSLTGAFQAGGTVTYSFFANNLCTAPGTVASIVTVTNSAVPGSRSVTFNATGSYSFQASYSGDSNNNGIVSSCEPFSVGKTGISVSTNLSSNSIVVGASVADTASVAGGFSPTGTVTFNVYVGSACSGSSIATRTLALVSGSAGPASVVFNSTGTYSWQATYNGDSNNNPASSTCGSETLTVTRAATTVSTTISSASITVGSPVSDTASVAGFSPTGMINFSVYSGSICSGTLVFSKTATLSSGMAGPVSVVLNSTGTYNWQAAYSGDGNNTIATSPCGSETVTVTRFAPSISTTLSSNSILVGTSGSDTAQVSGFAPTGTVTFNVYQATACSGATFDSKTVALTISGTAGPDSVQFNTAGTYNWQAIYSGDTNNAAVTSVCGSETLAVARSTPSVSTTLNISTITVGNSVSDSATVSGGYFPTGTAVFRVYLGAVCTGVPVASVTATISSSSAGPVTVVFNATGTYNWQAAYSGDLNNNPVASACGSETVTVQKIITSVSTSLSASSAIVGTAVSDTATVAGFNPTGTVTFSVYAGASCTGSPVATKGVSLSAPTSNPVSVIFNASGVYNWRAAYSGDANNLASNSSCDSEILTIQKISSAVSTNLSASSIIVGGSASDTATITGFNPAGTVTFSVYSNSVCTGAPIVSRTLSLVTGSAGPVPVVFNATGSFNWLVSYSGDSNNNPASSLCGSETLTVGKSSPTVSTQLSVAIVIVGNSVGDTATIAGGFSPIGIVTFSVYSGTGCSTIPIATKQASVSSSSAGPVPIIFNSTGPFTWQASYSGDSNNNAVLSPCGPETLTVTKTVPTLTTTLSANSVVVGNSVSDSATINGGFNPAGTITFSVYAGALCSGQPTASGTMTVSGALAGPVTVIFNSTGTYNWQAGYSGDGNNSAAASVCSSETLTVTRSSPSISTALSATATTVGTSITDTATAIGGFLPTGTVTFNVYAGSSCSGPVFDSKVIGLSTIGTAGPASVFFGTSGSYTWQALYGGDSNNNAISSVCGSETLTVARATPSVATTLSLSTIVVGNSVSDVATVSGGYNPIGTVNFSTYPAGVCAGTPTSTATLTLIGASAGPVGIIFNSTGTYNWQATYSGDSNNNPASSLCGSETLTVSKASTTLTTSLSSNSIVVGNAVSDAASLIGGFRPAGTVDFSVYSGIVCNGTPIATRTSVVSGLSAGPVLVTFNSTGGYTWQATYSGDSNNLASSSNCGSENLTITNATPSITTTLSRSTIAAGGSVTDTATLTGGFNLEGTVTFNVYSGSSCVGTPFATNTATVANGKAGPVSVTFATPGIYNWQVVYNGDLNNNVAASPCGSETLSVGGALAVGISLSSSSIIVGNTVSATSSVTGGLGPTGTVTFDAYTAACTGTLIVAKTLPLVTGSAGPVTVRFNVSTTYGWQAIYNGDSNNNPTSSPCETLTVQQTAPLLATTLSATSIIVGSSASDTATLSSAFHPGGTVTFSVYSGTGCSGTTLAIQTVALSTSGTAGPVIVSFSASGSYDWQASYSGDSNNAPAQSPCGSETLTVNKATPAITTTLSVLSATVGTAISDTAAVTGGFSPTGTVTFNVYLGTACSGTQVATATVPESGGSTAPLSIIFNSTGTMNWQATYNGDSNNKPVTSTCGSETLTVTKATLSVTTTLSGSSVVVGNSVTDLANTVGGFNPTGTFTFNVYSGPTCSGTPIDTQTVALSISGSAGPVSHTFISAGTFNWQAVYNGDSNNNAASSGCGSETLSVTKASPAVNTSLSASVIIVGTSATDTAVTIGGYSPSGTVTFAVYPSAVCSGTPIATKTLPLTANSAGPFSVTFNSTGTYVWQATYSGDANNNGDLSNCLSETLTVTKATPSLATNLSKNSIIVGSAVSDTATIGGGFNPQGTVTFTIYSGTDCSGTTVAVKTLSVLGVVAGPAVVRFNSTGTFIWQATYNGDNNNNAVQSSCGSETLSVGKASPSIVTSLSLNAISVGGSASDLASVSGSFNPSGTVAFSVYFGFSCNSVPVATSDNLVLSAGNAGPFSVTFNSSGTYNWQASYSGDSNNNPAFSTCGTETLAVSKVSPTVATTLSSATIPVGTSASDTAALQGGFMPTGSVTFNLFSGPVCSGTPVDSKSFALSTSGSAGPDSFSFNSAGTYDWQAVYSGDGNNNAASSLCGSESLTVSKITPAVSTSLSTSSVIVGNGVSDSASLVGGYSPVGTVTFSVFSGTTCIGSPIASQTVSLSGTNAGPVSVILNSTGIYNWQAAYNGDSNNNLAKSACGSEQSTVLKVTPAISTTLSVTTIASGTVSDTATISGGFGATGTVTFTVYSGTSCTGAAVATRTTTVAGGTAGPVSVNFTTPGVYNWQATYNGNSNNNMATSSCGSETLSVGGALAVGQTLSPASIIVGNSVSDTATITGGISPTGSVTFTVYLGSTCGVSSLVAKTAPLVGGSAGPVSVTFNASSTYSWQATYSGDNNNPSSSACSNLNVAKTSPSVTTTLSGGSIIVGNPASDIATVNSGFGLTGTVTFKTYAGIVCSGVSVSTRTANLSGNSAGPVTVILNATGTFTWQATYSGDSNNSPASSPCGSENLTVAKTTPTISTNLSATTAQVGASVSDTATVAGFTPTGTVRFDVYSGTLCSGTPLATKTLPLTGGNTGSSTIIFNVTGIFNWQATYSGDGNNNVVSSTCGSESSTIIKVAPVVTTTLSNSSATVGTPVTDSASLTGGFNPTGSVTFNVYSGTSCSASPIATETIALTGATAGPASVVFNNTGTFTWQAVYSGDSVNGLASSSCGSESLTVTKATVTFQTTLSPTAIFVGGTASDAATVSGGFSPSGAVVFKVFQGSLCSGTPVVSRSVSMSGASAASPSVIFNATGTFSWIATYSGDSNNNPASSSCGDEVLAVAKATPTINTHLSVTTIVVGGSATDSATLSNGFQPSGAIVFNLYSNSACTGASIDSLTVSTIGASAGPVSFTLSSSGTFYLQAAYGGDSNNNASSSACGVELLTVGKASSAISVASSATTITVGGSASLSATLTGGFQLGGTLIYQYVVGTVCTVTGAKTIGSAATVLNGVVPKSDSQTFNSVGIYGLFAVYNGDQNNIGGTSTCQRLTVVPALSSISPITVSAGSTVRFSVNATDPDTSQTVTLTPDNLPSGAQFSTAQSFTDGTTSSVFTWTPSDGQAPGDYNVTFIARVGQVESTSQVTIHVIVPVKAPGLPIVSYSIFGIVGFLAVIAAAILLRRIQTKRRSP